MYVRSGPHVMFQVKDKQKLIAQKQGTCTTLPIFLPMFQLH
jgi:hypothetical protein